MATPYSFLLIIAGVLFLGAPLACSANQAEEQLSHSVATAMRSHLGAPYGALPETARMQARDWVQQALHAASKLPAQMRVPFLERVHYEATRAALDPWLVLAVIQVESGFSQYATSHVGAQGYMQVMPFWKRLIGAPDHNLYDPSTNLRFGCTILRHYLQREQGNMTRALARYNGSLGKTVYPDMVFAAMHKLKTKSAKK